VRLVGQQVVGAGDPDGVARLVDDLRAMLGDAT